MIVTPLTIGGRDYTLSKETARRHLQERAERAMQEVQTLEIRIGIETRWAVGDENWIRVDKMLREREYRRALDTLEGLVIARLFELTKLNQSQTGKSKLGVQRL